MPIKYGNKFDPKLSLKEISKTIRREILEAKKEGFLPKISVSVRCEKNSIRCTIKGWEGNAYEFSLKKGDEGGWYPVHGDNFYWSYKKELKEAIQYLRDLLEQYNYDGHDYQTDYYCCNFYASVDLEWKTFESEKKKFIDELELDGDKLNDWFSGYDVVF